MVLIIITGPNAKRSRAKMMHSSSSVGAGPYDPGGAEEGECGTNETLVHDATIAPVPAQKLHELCSPTTSLPPNKQKPEVSRHHTRPRPPYQQEGVSAQLRSNPKHDGGSGWCELSVEYDRTDEALDNFSFAPVAATAAIVANNNHKYVHDDDDDNDEGEDDYVWGPQHLFYAGHRSDHKDQAQLGYGHGAYEAASAAAASVQSSGRQLMGSFCNHLPGRNGGGDGAIAYALDGNTVEQSKLKVEPCESNAGEEATSRRTQNDLPYMYEMAPPAAVSMSRGYSGSSDVDSFTRDDIISSVHTETYIFEGVNGNEGIDSSDGIFEGDKPLFASRRESMANASRNMKFSEDDDASYATANSEINNYDDEVVLSGISLLDVDGDVAANNCHPTAYTASQEIDHETLRFPGSAQSKPKASFQESEQDNDDDDDDDDDHFYNADEQEYTLRTEVVEVLQEDIGRVNDAFLETLHKTSALMQPIAEVARRQSSTSSPIRQRLSGISQTAIDITRSVSDRASSTATVVIPTRQSIREKSIRLWDRAHEVEETLVHAAYETEKTAIAAAEEAISHIHVHVPPAPTIKMPEVISGALKSVEVAAEELRVNNVDVQSGVDDAELLGQLTAGAYA